MSKNKFVNIPPSVLALTQLARLRVTNNPVILSFFWLFHIDRGCEREKWGQRGREGDRLYYEGEGGT
jgi:hypothetical protein